jgi:hypothetical protein
VKVKFACPNFFFIQILAPLYYLMVAKTRVFRDLRVAADVHLGAELVTQSGRAEEKAGLVKIFWLATKIVF